jgi:predicted CopG family antitoxin
MSRAIDITDEQYRILNEMRREDRSMHRKSYEPFKDVIQRLLDAYVPPGKD